MKPILKWKNLAINGALLTFEQQLHVGRPDIGSRKVFMKYVDDVFECRRLNDDGPMVQQLEQRVAELYGVKHCVTMGNCTVALEITICAPGLK